MQPAIVLRCSERKDYHLPFPRAIHQPVFQMGAPRLQSSPTCMTQGVAFCQ
jgi:hypothetical protein